jgi:hypothetical protein
MEKDPADAERRRPSSSPAAPPVSEKDPAVAVSVKEDPALVFEGTKLRRIGGLYVLARKKTGTD